MRRRGLLESRSKYRRWGLRHGLHRRGVGYARRGDSDGSAPAYAYAFGEFGHGGLGFGFSFPQIGVLGAIAEP
jgi:hypothetical protein